MRKRSLSWIKKLTQEDIIVKKEPPRRNKSVKGGEIFEGKSSQNIKNRERRRNLSKLNPIKWTQQKPIWDVFWKPVSYCGHSKN